MCSGSLIQAVIGIYSCKFRFLESHGSGWGALSNHDQVFVLKSLSLSIRGKCHIDLRMGIFTRTHHFRTTSRENILPTEQYLVLSGGTQVLFSVLWGDLKLRINGLTRSIHKVGWSARGLMYSHYGTQLSILDCCIESILTPLIHRGILLRLINLHSLILRIFELWIKFLFLIIF